MQSQQVDKSYASEQHDAINRAARWHTSCQLAVIASCCSLAYGVWQVIFAGVKFGDFESKRYTINFAVFKFGGC
jgi:hypothetical protein